MSMQDPIADMLTRIRNACQRKHLTVDIPTSKHKEAILNVLLAEGYIESFAQHEKDGIRYLRVALKYFNGTSVITMLKRQSRPALRNYAGKNEIPRVLGGLGTVILTTSKGLMTDKMARLQGLGGEIICLVA